MIAFIANLFRSGFLERILDTVDNKIDNDTDRNKVKADLIQTHLKTRAGFMEAGGFWLMLLFAVPLAFWHAAVVFASVFWCPGCAYPQSWTVAALPAPLDEWAGIIIVSIFGVIGLKGLRK